MLPELEKVRKKRLLLKRLRQERTAMEPSLQSPSLSGMPHGTAGKSEQLERGIDARTEMDEMIRRVFRELLEEDEPAARREMDRLTPELYTFCLHYYVSALPVLEVCRIIDRGESTFYRYKKELVQYDERK